MCEVILIQANSKHQVFIPGFIMRYLIGLFMGLKHERYFY